MEHFFNQLIFENTVKSYFTVAGAILVAFIIKRFISKYFARIIYKVISKKGNLLHKDAFVNLIIPPLELFIVVFISFVALDKLTYPKALDIVVYKVKLFDIIDSISNGIIIIIFVWLCLRAIDFIAMILEDKAKLNNDFTDNQLIVFFKDFFKAILIITGILLIIKFSFRKDVNGILTGLSLIGAALALATKESIENLIASFIIFFDKPFVTGDLVKVNAFTGTIEKIGLRSTRIRTENKTYITVPNKQMVDTIIDNFSLRTQRRGDLRLELDVLASVDSLKNFISLIKAYLQSNESVANSIVSLADTGKDAHIINITYFSNMPQTYDDFVLMSEAINFKAIELIEELNIELAATYTDVIIKQ